MENDNNVISWSWSDVKASVADGQAKVERDVIGHKPKVSLGNKPGRKKRGHRGTSNKIYYKDHEHDNRTKRRLQDVEFIKAMAHAIRRGLERPPRVGIDTTPCTKAPVFIPHGGKGAPVKQDLSKDEIPWSRNVSKTPWQST